MSDELRISLSLTFSKSGTTRDISPATIKPDIALVPSIDNVQSVGTSWEAAQLGDIADLGFVYIENLDGTNFIEYGAASDGTNKFGEIGPSEFNLVKVSGNGFYLKADTSACNVRVAAFSR